MWRKIGCTALILIAVGLVVAVVVQQRRGDDGGYKFSFGRSKSTEDKDPVFEPAARGDLALVVEATGTTEPISDIQVKSEATGRIVEMPVEEGDVLEAGDIIARLDQSNQELVVRQQRLSVQRAELAYQEARGGSSTTQRSGLESAQANAQSALQAAEVTLANAETALATTQAEHSRFVELHSRGYVTDQEVERSRQAVDDARSRVDNARTQLASARASLDNARTQLAEFAAGSNRNAIEQARLGLEQARVSLAEAEKQLGDSVIRAPIAGIVLEKPVDVGDSVTSINAAFGEGTTVVKVADLSRVQVRTSVDEIDIGKIKVGQPATVVVDAHPTREFSGTVTNVFPQGVQSPGGLTSFIALVEVDNADGVLLGNMTATVRIEAEKVEDALLVPLSATRAGEGENTTIVYVLKEGEDPTNEKAKTEEREVVLGETDFSQVAVLEGLEEGEMVKARGFATSIQFD